LNGDRDLQVDASDTVPLLRQAYEKSGNKDFHGTGNRRRQPPFSKSAVRFASLYGAIEETMAPEVLNAITAWVAKHTAQ
jgi:hypothetical protein